MKRIFPLCMAILWPAAASAQIDLQYHPAEPNEQALSSGAQEKHSLPRHQIWNAEKLARDNERAIQQEREQELADSQRRRQREQMLGDRPDDRSHRSGKYRHSYDHNSVCMPPGFTGNLKWDDNQQTFKNEPALCGKIEWD